VATQPVRAFLNTSYVLLCKSIRLGLGKKDVDVKAHTYMYVRVTKGNFAPARIYFTLQCILMYRVLVAGSVFYDTISVARLYNVDDMVISE
jgi:hypothetical protein